MPYIKAASKMAAFALWSLLLVPPQILFLLFHRGQNSYFIPHLWHRGVCRIFGLKVKIEGVPAHDAQTLFVSNHLSYLDIPIIGSVLKASFVAKAEVAGWPVFGFLSRMQQTAFISRSKNDAAQVKNALSQMLAEGKSLILFPEGTSTDGRGVYPFKSSLFSLALRENAEGLMVQPFTVKMERVDGHEIVTQDDRDLYAWHINMTRELPVHLWLFAQSSGALISLKFHEPFPASLYQDRKVLAKTCHERVSRGLEAETASQAA